MIGIKKLSEILKLDLDYFVRGGFWLTFSAVLSALAGIILSSLFARLWPRDVYGQFSFLIFAVGFLSITTLPGMVEAVFQGSIENKDGVFRKAIKKVVLWSCLGAGALIFGSFYFFVRDNSNLAIAVFLAALAFPFSTLSSLIIAFYNGKKQFKKSSLISVVANLFSVAFTALALIKFGGLIQVTLFSMWSTAIVNIFLTLKALSEIKSFSEDKKLIKLGMFLSFSQFIWLSLDYLDKLLIPLFLGYEKFAVYTFAILIPLQIQNFFKSFVILGQPKIADIADENVKRVLISKSLLFESVIFSIVLVYIILCPFIYRILYPGYEESVLLSQLFALSLLYYPSNLFGSYLVKKRVIKGSMIVTIIYFVSSTLTLLIFLHFWGLIGAILSKIFSRIIQIIITQFIFLREVKTK